MAGAADRKAKAGTEESSGSSHRGSGGDPKGSRPKKRAAGREQEEARGKGSRAAAEPTFLDRPAEPKAFGRKGPRTGTSWKQRCFHQRTDRNAIEAAMPRLATGAQDRREQRCSGRRWDRGPDRNSDVPEGNRTGRKPGETLVKPVGTDRGRKASAGTGLGTRPEQQCQGPGNPRRSDEEPKGHRRSRSAQRKQASPSPARLNGRGKVGAGGDTSPHYVRGRLQLPENIQRYPRRQRGSSPQRGVASPDAITLNRS